MKYLSEIAALRKGGTDQDGVHEMCRRLLAERKEEQEVCAGLRTGIIALRRERDEARTERDKMIIKSAELAEELKVFKRRFDAVSEGIEAMVAGNSKPLSMVGDITKPSAKRRSNSSKDVLSSTTKKPRLEI